MGYRLDWEPEGVYWKYYGNISGEDVIEASTSIYGDQRFDTLKYKLVDFLDVASIKMDKDEVALIAYQHLAAERSNPYLKSAIVIKQSDNELVNTFVSFFRNSSWEVKIFQHLDEANNWLGRKSSC